MKKASPKSKPAAKKAAGTKQAKAAGPVKTMSVLPTTSVAVRGEISSVLVRQLAGMLDETGLSEIEYDTGGVRIRIARHGGAHFAAAPAPVHLHTSAAPSAAAPSAAPADPANHPGTVKSPMVGVAYLSPEPGAAPFVKVGDTVVEGQTLALIEAMKTFNHVKAQRGGKVTQILFENGSPVEYGEALMVIE